MTKLLLLVTCLLPLAVAAAAPASPTSPASPVSPVSSDDVIAALKKADQAQMVLDLGRKDPAHASPDLGAQGQKIAAECNDTVDRALAGGAPAASILLVDGYKKVVLGSVKPEHCAPLAELARDLDAKIAAATSQRDSALAGPFKAAGITGDKLEWAIRWSKNDYDLYGVGGTILAPSQVKAARLLFLVTGDADHLWELHRYAFLGDKLMGSTRQQFVVRPGPSKFR
jgi:hypothetical protein